MCLDWNMAVQTKFLWLWKGRSPGGSYQWLARVLARQLGSVRSLLRGHGGERIRRRPAFTPELNGVKRDATKVDPTAALRGN